MNLYRPTPRAVSLAALVAAAVPLGLTRCSYDYQCDRTTAAIVLPAPGDTIVLHGRACIDPEDGFTALVGVNVEGDDLGSAPVRLSVIDPVTGEEVPSFGSSLDFQADPAHCDEGVTITIENTTEAPLTAMVWLTGDAEKFARCDVFLEAP